MFTPNFGLKNERHDFLVPQRRREGTGNKILVGSGAETANDFQLPRYRESVRGIDKQHMQIRANRVGPIDMDADALERQILNDGRACSCSPGVRSKQSVRCIGSTRLTLRRSTWMRR